MTYRQILRSLEVGGSWTFQDREKAQSAMTRACKLYDCDRKFRQVGAVVTRVA